MDMAAAKQAHITAIRARIPAATATLNAQGIRMSASEFSNRITLKDVSPGQYLLQLEARVEGTSKDVKPATRETVLTVTSVP